MPVAYLPVVEWETELKVRLNQRELPGWKIFCPQKVNSTMDFLREVHKEQPAYPILVLAKYQTAGRGRQGRQWISSDDSLFMTLGFKTEHVDYSAFALVVALAVNKVLSKLNCTTLIKWPNDLLSRDFKKISGILIEKYADCLAIGIGINLKYSLVENSTDLSKFIENPDLLQIASDLGSLIYMYYSIFNTSGFVAFRDEYTASAIPLDSEILLDISGNNQPAVYKGVDERGVLQVFIEGQLKSLTSAEIRRLYVVSN